MNRYIVLLVVFLVSMTGVELSKAQQANVRVPEFRFKDGDPILVLGYDMGKVPEGPIAVHVFDFLNKGNAPLLIDDVSASCGCIITDWTKGAILPGKKGSITVSYMTDGRVGPFKKDIHIRSNVRDMDGKTVLHLRGVVTPKEPELPATGN